MSLTFFIGVVFFLFLILIGFTIILWSIRNGISPMPSSARAKSVILNVLPAETNFHKTICELGAGWGTLAFALAAKFPHSNIVAYETSPLPYLFCRIRQWITPFPNLHFHRQNFLAISLVHADTIVCYLYPGAMLKLKSKFEEEPFKCVVISNTFRIPGWEAKHTFEILDLYQTKVYVYEL
jgi:hypothetical protein